MTPSLSAGSLRVRRVAMEACNPRAITERTGPGRLAMQVECHSPLDGSVHVLSEPSRPPSHDEVHLLFTVCR